MTTQTIGRYRLDQTVGEGAYGTVYRAVDPTLDRAVAIKLLKPDVRDASGPEESLEEAKTLAKMNHPNIVTLFEVLEEAGQTALVMEFIDGEPLGDYLERANPSLSQRLMIARQIADALAEAHGHGIVHADIKPGNVIVVEGAKPVVVDFGLSKAVPQTTELATLTGGSVGQNMILGTLAYMAPEVMKGAKPDERSDIFSFGALFYELLTGKRAFKAPSDAEVVNLVLNVDPMPVSAYTEDIPAWCTNLAARMLAKDAEGRPQSFRDILKAMDTREVESPLQDRGAAQPARGRMITGKRMVIMLLLMIAAVTGFIGAQYYEAETPTISSRINAGLDNLRNAVEKGAVKQAEVLFQSVLTEDPENAAATAGYSLALAYQFADVQADPAILRNAEAAAQLAIGLDDNLALSHVAAAWVQEFRGQSAPAEQSFRTALQLDPTNYFALLGLGRFLMRQGDLDEAIEIVQSAVGVYPQDGWFLAQLGDMYLRKGDYDRAEQLVRRGIAMAPDNILAYRTLSAVLFAKDDTLGAIAAVQRGLQIRPDPTLYSNLGTAYFSLGQYPQSVDAFERAIDAQGNSHNYIMWANLADAYRMVPGGADKAKLAYRRAIQLLTERLRPNETRPALVSRAGLYYAKAGDAESAAAMTARALALNPDNRWVLFRAAIVADLGGKRPDALDLLERAIGAGQPMSDVRMEPDLANLRQDPRYHQMMARREEANR